MRKSALRQANERLVLNAIRENPQLSRVEISRITSLSPSSITFIVKRLLKEKLIREQKVGGAPQVGRPPTILQLAPLARLAVGVEIRPGISRIALADWTGKILETRDVPWQSGAENMLRALHGGIRKFVATNSSGRVLGVGVSVPGTWDSAASTVTTAVNLGWRDVAVASILSKGFDVPFYFDNNANLSAVGERWFQSDGGRPLEDFVFVTLGSGIGTGIITAGHLFHGAFGRAGEFGHMVLYPDGRKCLCGNSGCWEEYASDRALSRIYSEATERRAIPVEQIVQSALNDEPAALATLKEAAHHLALGMANLIIGLNPEAVIVDNWAAAGWSLVEKEVWALLRKRVPSPWLEGIRIRPSSHAEDAPLHGAVALALTRYFHSFDHEEAEEPANRVHIR